ncbi:GNAT family N-acetyltransferase [Flaviaesturariibacter flavus]|uniref:GNAT family N-acetyltransferase n=1 Tax=Flaviaesturariibacter flavus TaxID=2502780 RepID=A0A4R1BN63_9BACT|nr:GNAT family N-acetyltransferase [Flaviaesturariibacter flavus]TCJ18787.1 GNAT family N-acetyltransferase [Flaviaesturariibacter flavus]
MEGIEIRRATAADLSALQQVGRQTFAETFSDTNTEENMRRYLAESFAAQKLTAELNAPHSEFYFAVLNGAVAGYLKVNSGPAQTGLQEAGALEIERIYVLREFQAKKIGQLLFEKAVRVARQQGAAYVWLGVWEENEKAIDFYKKNGFVAFDKHLFRLGNDVQTDILMKLKL